MNYDATYILFFIWIYVLTIAVTHECEIFNANILKKKKKQRIATNEKRKLQYVHTQRQCVNSFLTSIVRRQIIGELEKKFLHTHTKCYCNLQQDYSFETKKKTKQDKPHK